MASNLARLAGIALLALVVTLASGCGYHEHNRCHRGCGDGHYWGHHYEK